MRSLVWMLGTTFLLAGCGKKPKDEAKTPPPAGGGDEFLVVDQGRAAGGGNGNGANPPPPPTPVDNRNTNFRPGQTVLRNTYRAGQRAGLMAEMDQIGGLLNPTVIVDDRMPSAAEIRDELRKGSAKLAGLIADGTVILTDTKDKAGMWAYEIDSEKAGGIALVAGRASRYSAEQITAMLPKK